MAWSKRQVYLFGTGATVAGRGLEIGCGFGIVWCLTRMLGVEGYGVYVVALAVVELTAIVGAGGLESTVVYRTSRADAPPGELDDGAFAAAAFRWGLLLSAVLSLGLWLGAEPVASLFDEPGAAFWLAALALLIPVQMARNIYVAWHRGRQRIPQATLLGRGLPRLTTLLALAAALWLAPTKSAIAAALVLGPLAVLAPWFAHTPLDPLRPRGRLEAWDVQYALKLSFNRLLARGITYADILFLGLLSSAAVTAHYGVASRIALLTPVVFGILMPTFVSRVGYLHGRGERAELESEYDQTRSVALLGALLVAAAIGLFGRFALRLFGDFEGAAPVMWILSAAWLAQVSFGMNRSYLGLAGYGGWTLATSAGLLLSNIALNVYFIPRWGGVGAAMASLLSIVGIRAVTSIVIWKLDGFRTYSLELAALTACAVALLLAGAAGWIGGLPLGVGLLALAGLLAMRHHRAWTAQVGGLLEELRGRRAAR